MNTYIVLLRGINVGGHKKVPMADLRELLSNSGFKDVKTYIQSGNIILQSSEEKRSVETKVQKSIMSHFGFDIPVIARTRHELVLNFDNCPFSEEKKTTSYFVLLSDFPVAESLELAMQISYDNEEFQIIEDCLYLYSSVGYGNSKFNMNMFEKKLGVRATSRNYKTMVKLLSLSQN